MSSHSRNELDTLDQWEEYNYCTIVKYIYIPHSTDDISPAGKVSRASQSCPVVKGTGPLLKTVLVEEWTIDPNQGRILPRRIFFFPPGPLKLILMARGMSNLYFPDLRSRRSVQNPIRKHAFYMKHIIPA
ncbi:hypothetical protein J6590_081638 [Homalodisca vitripennis]|nr:hypothetical protein J6590_081638 [Homalodisca vitripennis]